MDRTERIDINTLIDMVEDSDAKNKNVIKWNGIDVIINPTLSLKEVLTFVDNVVQTCFSDSEGAYIPEVKDFAIKKCILEMYANFDLPSNVEECYSFIYNSDAVDFVISHINNSQLMEIVQSSEEKMKHLAQANIEMVNRQMNELYTAFDNLQKQITGIYENIDIDDVSNLVSAIANGHIDEEKMVKAFIKEHASK